MTRFIQIKDHSTYSTQSHSIHLIEDHYVLLKHKKLRVQLNLFRLADRKIIVS